MVRNHVTISLVALSVVVAAIIFERYFRFRKAMKISAMYAPEVASAIRELEWEEALALSEKHAEKSHMAKVVFYGLRERKDRIDALPEALVAKHMGHTMERAIIVINDDHRSWLGILDAIGATSPFIGALGGSALTFAFGIILAVPTIWFATYFRSKTLVLESEMKNAASELTSHIEAVVSMKLPE